MTEWTPSWIVTGTSGSPHNTSWQKMKKLLKLTDNEENGRSFNKSGVADNSLREALLVQRGGKCNFLNDIKVDPTSIPSDTYFDIKWREARNDFWKPVVSLDYGEMPRLLAFSLGSDSLNVCNLVMAGAQCEFDKSGFRSIAIKPSVPPSAIMNYIIDTLPPNEKFYGLSVQNMIPQMATVAERPQLAWLQPRFSIGREPFHDYWKMHLIDDETRFEGIPDDSFVRHPAASWLEWTTIRYGSQVRRDPELVQLFAGAFYCLPALVEWQRLFCQSTCIKSSSIALAAATRILLEWHRSGFDGVNWICELDRVGFRTGLLIPVQGGKALMVKGRLTEDEWIAIRLLVPPKRLQYYFRLNESQLDRMVLA